MPPTLGVLDVPPVDVMNLTLGVTASAFNVTSTSHLNVNATLGSGVAAVAGSDVACVCCGGPTKPPYDAEGAMKFTVAVVMVYGIGVIGMLGFYTRRTMHSHLMEKEANSYVRIIKRDKRRFERATQQSALRNLIQSVHGQGLQRSDSFPRVGASPLRNPRLVSPFLLPLLTTTLQPVGEVGDGGSGEEGEATKKTGEGEGQKFLGVGTPEDRRGSISRNVSLPARMEDMAETYPNGFSPTPRGPRVVATPSGDEGKELLEVKIPGGVSIEIPMANL